MWNHILGLDGWSVGWAWFALVHLVWWLVLIVAGVLIVRAVLGSRGRDDALDILRERYARGEIDQAEFEERRKLLQA